MDEQGARTYDARSTSRRTAVFDAVEIVVRGSADGSQKRLVLKVRAVDNPPTPGATLSATLVYQHRRRADEDWTEDNFNLANLHAGQEVRMELHSAETLRIFQELERLYAATGAGVRSGRYSVTVTDADEEVAVVPREIADQIEGLLHAEGPGVFETIAGMRPDLARWAALVEEHKQRAVDLLEFEGHLSENPPTWNEKNWQKFFRRAPWIFGHGLDYMFLVDEEMEADYGGSDFGGTGGERGDFLVRTAGHFRFAVLVELKLPTTPLVSGTKPYRNGAWRVGAEVAGGVAQLQANCDRITVAANTAENARYLADRALTVADPQAILVIGHTGQLADEAQRASFHRFRQNLWNPTVLTYDELFERARFLVDKAAVRAAEASTTSTTGSFEGDSDGLGELPF